MKTKLALFVTVLAAALFGVGCASVPKPDVANAVKWNGHWYAVLPSANWDTAKQKCEDFGGHLAYVESEAENDFLINLLKQKQPIDTSPNDPYGPGAWLGGTDEDKEGEWLWLNGRSFTYKNWANESPNNQSGTEHFAELIWHRAIAKGTWNDDSKTALNLSICEWE